MKISARCLNRKRAKIQLVIHMSSNRDMVRVRVLKVTGVKRYDVLRIGSVRQTRHPSDLGRGTITFTVMTTMRTPFTNWWETTHWRFNRLPRLLRYLLTRGHIRTNDPDGSEFTASTVQWIKIQTI